MNKYLVRFNKSRGQPGRGSPEHAWRVFENGDHEFIAMDVRINVPTWSETDGVDWSLACQGFMQIVDDVVIINGDAK